MTQSVIPECFNPPTGRQVGDPIGFPLKDCGNDKLIMPKAFIGAGSNLGNREANLEAAKERLTLLVKFLCASPVYETDPVGGPPQGKYLNAVWEIETSLGADDLLNALLEIESAMGRVRKEKNGPRVIDLDILFCGDQIVNKPGLRIPHPRLHEREFVLKPMMDLAPDFRHPVFKKTITELLGVISTTKGRRNLED